MLDNLRDQASSSQIFHDDEPPAELPDQPKLPKPRRTFDQITGMTAPQRFALSFMLLIIVFMMGVAFLVLTSKIVLPGF